MKSRSRVIPATLLALSACWAAQELQAGSDKTLVAWVAPANLTQQGGSALTIQSGDRFDAIVFGEKVARRWMAGSDRFARTQAEQGDNPAETADDKTVVQIAIAYQGD